MGDIESLKAKNRIEEVIEESGFELEREPGARYWKCQNAPDLTVDIERQYYYWERENERESGDVIAWLQARHGWGLPKVLRYLHVRVDLPAELRPRRPVFTPEPESIEEESESPAIDKDQAPIRAEINTIGDREAREAYRLGHDFPWFQSGFQRWLTMGLGELISFYGILPDGFISIVSGDWQDESCDICGRDLEGQRKVFLPCVLGANYEFERGAAGGLWCGGCEMRVNRWRSALDILIRRRFRAGIEPAEPEEIPPEILGVFSGPLRA